MNAYECNILNAYYFAHGYPENWHVSQPDGPSEDEVMEIRERMRRAEEAERRRAEEAERRRRDKITNNPETQEEWVLHEIERVGRNNLINLLNQDINNNTQNCRNRINATTDRSEIKAIALERSGYNSMRINWINQLTYFNTISTDCNEFLQFTHNH